MIDYTKIDWSKCKLPNVGGKPCRLSFESCVNGFVIRILDPAEPTIIARRLVGLIEWHIAAGKENDIRDTLACIDTAKTIILENLVKRISGREALVMLVKAYPMGVRMRQANATESCEHRLYLAGDSCVELWEGGLVKAQVNLANFIRFDHEIQDCDPESTND